MASTTGRTGPEGSGDAASPLRRMPLYAQAEKVLEDLLVHRQYRIGDRIPPEAELVRSLGVSRATIRAAVGRLAGRGLLVRRQGSGTFLARLPEQVGQPSPVGIKLGSNVAQLGRLETYTSIAERLGLKAESDQLHVEAARSAPDEAGALELPAASEVIRVSRVLRFDGETAAWMIDVLPADLMSAGTLKERLTPHQMVLDVLLDAGKMRATQVQARSISGRYPPGNASSDTQAVRPVRRHPPALRGPVNRPSPTGVRRGRT